MQNILERFSHYLMEREDGMYDICYSVKDVINEFIKDEFVECTSCEGKGHIDREGYRICSSCKGSCKTLTLKPSNETTEKSL